MDTLGGSAPSSYHMSFEFWTQVVNLAAKALNPMSCLIRLLLEPEIFLISRKKETELKGFKLSIWELAKYRT